MCGIVGFTGFKDTELLHRMMKLEAHRGPDGEGEYVDGEYVSLGHLRLSIIDRAHGQQPMFSSDKKLVLIYNGEIYNFQELRAELEAKGHQFQNNSDSEVILYAFKEWGVESFDRFNGMFAFALYDIERHTTYLVRDHFGIKPLYYAETKDGVLFASEIKPIFYSDKIPKAPHDESIYRYLQFRLHDDTPQTFFDGIKRLMPGEYMTIADGKSEIKTYSSLTPRSLLAQDIRKDSPTLVTEFDAVLTKSIADRLVSEVPVGTALSGGLDSSTVVAKIARLMKEKGDTAKAVGDRQQTFSAVFPNSVNDEERYIDDLLKMVGSSVASHKIQPTSDGFIADLADFVRTQEEPTISTGPYAQYCVMREATNHVTVLLDGQGADEMMAGYVPYLFVYLKQLRKQRKWGTLAKEVLSSTDIMRHFFWTTARSAIFKGQSLSTSDLLNPEYLKKHVTVLRPTLVQDNLKARLANDVFYESLPSLLRYEDKNTMRFSMEGRVPFLDLDLMRFVFSLPDSAIIRSGWNKRVMRDAAKDILPASINKRRNKIGFTTPEYEWFLRLKNRIYQIFMSESFMNRPYFNQPEVVKAFEAFIKGKNRETMVFWRLMNVELWLREFFDEKTKEAPQQIKDDYTPNADKETRIKAGEGEYDRYTVRTDVFKKGDNFAELIKDNVQRFWQGAGAKNITSDKPWFVVISEKLVAISQGRSYFIWDIKAGVWARLLSKYVTRTPNGIGLGSPWTMQLAIQEAGLPRIIVASIGGIVGKLVGKRGVFYNLAGANVRAIDGPTEYSLYPSNVSAKLPPKDPEIAAAAIADAIRSSLEENERVNFVGAVIIDANDIGRNVMGNTTGLEDELVADIFRDNPMGQAAEQTPLTVVVQSSVQDQSS